MVVDEAIIIIGVTIMKKKGDLLGKRYVKLVLPMVDSRGKFAGFLHSSKYFYLLYVKDIKRFVDNRGDESKEVVVGWNEADRAKVLRDCRDELQGKIMGWRKKGYQTFTIFRTKELGGKILDRRRLSQMNRYRNKDTQKKPFRYIDKSYVMEQGYTEKLDDDE